LAWRTEIDERDNKAVQGQSDVNQKLIPTTHEIEGLKRLSERKSKKHEYENQTRAAPEEK
jgi:hypothetical protein